MLIGTLVPSKILRETTAVTTLPLLLQRFLRMTRRMRYHGIDAAAGDVVIPQSAHVGKRKDHLVVNITMPPVVVVVGSS